MKHFNNLTPPRHISIISLTPPRLTVSTKGALATAISSRYQFLTAEVCQGSHSVIVSADQRGLYLRQKITPPSRFPLSAQRRVEMKRNFVQLTILRHHSIIFSFSGKGLQDEYLKRTHSFNSERIKQQHL